jgi:hypothetical protein
LGFVPRKASVAAKPSKPRKIPPRRVRGDPSVVPVPVLPSLAGTEQRDRSSSIRMAASEWMRIQAAARRSGFRYHTEWMRLVILSAVEQVEDLQSSQRRLAAAEQQVDDVQSCAS